MPFISLGFSCISMVRVLFYHFSFNACAEMPLLLGLGDTYRFVTEGGRYPGTTVRLKEEQNATETTSFGFSPPSERSQPFLEQ